MPYSNSKVVPSVIVRQPAPAAGKLRARRRGLTLVEVLIATTITLLMLAALAEGFKRIGDSIAENRAALEVANRMRGVAMRLKQDLEGVTLRLTPPANPSSGQGYFEYFEGPMCDYSPTLFVGDKTSADPNVYAPGTRYGDFDDVAMFTSRAGDTWFTGKVPRYILKLAQGLTPVYPDDLQPEVIASQYAEIVWFVRPHDDAGIPNSNLADAIGFDDADQNNLPDLMKLHRRVLLIRPDLNLTGTLNGVSTPMLPAYTAAGSWMVATKDPFFGMHLPHQQCDLSLRRVVDNSGGATVDRVAANSLQDLMQRENRFAHFIRPVSGGASMPLMSLETAYNVALAPTPAVNTALNNRIPGNGYVNGALHSAFVLQDRTDPSLTLFGSPGNPIYENRIGEDVIATFCVGFDLQGFDPQVPLLYLPGPDGTLAAGAAGTDDVVVDPNDPGYLPAMLAAAGNPTAFLAGTGAYVNLGWMRHVVNNSSNPSGIATVLQGSSLTFESPLSGISVVRLGTARPFSDSLYRSGLFFQNTSASNQLWGQMTYDTWTDAYEVDGILQSDTTYNPSTNPPTPYSGTIQLASPISGYWRQSTDAGRDGIDNGPITGGIDDPDEWETSAPFPTALRSVKAILRFEEPDTRQLFQESITAEFVSH